MAVSFKVQAVKSVSVGKVEFRAALGQHLADTQEMFRSGLVADGYSADMAEKIVDNVLTQVFGFLSGPSVADKTEAKAE